MGKKEMIQRNRACREKVEALIRRNKKQREEIVELYGENLEVKEQLEELMRMIEEQRAKITAAGPEGWSRKYARGWTDAQVLTVTLVLAGCIVAVVVLNLVRG
nr:MAG TPA: hypothetical protein [Caudoviricetes sp.]